MKKFMIGAGIATIALLGFTALFGASSASAARLCKEEGLLKECPGAKFFPVGTPIDLLGLSEFGLGFTTVKCGSSEWEGRVTAAGGAGNLVPVQGVIESAEWKECTCKTAALGAAPWKVSFYGTGIRDGEMSYEVEIEFDCAGIKCKYATTAPPEFPVVKGGAPAELQVGAALKKTGGSFVCKDPAIWGAVYNFAEPFGMYVTEK